MYPLNTILIGHDEGALPHIKRELFNCSAHVEAEVSQASDAIGAFRKTRGENRLVVYHVASSRDVESLGQLTSNFPGWPVLAVVGGSGPSALPDGGLIDVVRAGASQIVQLPLRREDLEAALDRIASQHVYAHRNTNVIAVAGVTGGCGATTLAINLAYEIAHRHSLRCVLVDLSLRMGIIATHLNLEPEHSILDLLRDVRRLDTTLVQKTLVKAAENFMVLPGPEGIAAAVDASPEDVAQVVDTLKLIADVVVLDVPCSYDDIFFETIANAGQAVLIGEQTLPSIRALSLVRETLKHERESSEHLVINRFDPKSKDFTLESMRKPLGVSHLNTVVRDAASMDAAMAKGCPIRHVAPRSEALAEIVALTEVLLGRGVTRKDKSSGILKQLSRVFSHA